MSDKADNSKKEKVGWRKKIDNVKWNQ